MSLPKNHEKIDDPFAIFGDSENDDDDDHEDFGNDAIDKNKNNNSFVRTKQQPIKSSTTKSTSTTNQILASYKLSKIPKLDPKASTSMIVTNDPSTSTSTQMHKNEIESNTIQDDTSTFPWSSVTPLYMNPNVKYVQSLQQFGGSRGLIATQILVPGTLVLLEEPILAWNENDFTSLDNDDNANNNTNELDIDTKLLQILNQYLFQNNETLTSSASSQHQQQLIHNFEHFHPTKSIVDECVQYLDVQSHNNPSATLSSDTIEQVYSMIQNLHLRYKSNNQENENDFNMKLFYKIMSIVTQNKFTNSNGAILSCYDIYRLILVLRYNGLQSGMYYYSAMLNHSDDYNCVKFFPNNNKNNNNLQHYSEIRTTRTIQIGEPLTISYIPKILSYTSRRHYLWEQHRFDISNDNNDLIDVSCMELITNKFPITASIYDYKNTVTYRIESAVSELEIMFNDIQSIINSTTVDDDIINQIRELEQASLELCKSSEYELLQNHQHILLVPCLRLHVDICDVIQQYDTQLTFIERMKLLTRLIISAYHLRTLQILLYGPDHYDIARTNFDVVQGIEELLSRSPKHLFDIQLKDAHNGFVSTNITSWSSMEYTIRKDYERIKALYPHNANEYISSNVNKVGE